MMDWLKLWDEAKDDPKLESLSDAQFRVWFRLLCLCNRGKPRGTIPPMRPRLLALEVSRGDVALLQQTIEALTDLDIIAPWGDGGYSFVNWAKRQARKPSDEPQAIKERVTRYRERKRAEMVETPDDLSVGNADVTRYDAFQGVCNADVTPPDKEEDIDIESSPPLIPPLSGKTAAPVNIHEAAMRLPGLRPEAMAVMGALEQAACELLDRNRLTKAQERTIRAFAGEMNGALTVAVIEAALTAAPQYKGGDQLAYLFQVIRNKVNGVGKVSNGNGSNGNGHSNGHSQGPPDGYSWEKDDAGRYIPLGGDPRTGKLPYGARDPVEANKRHREMSIQQRTTGGGIRN